MLESFEYSPILWLYAIPERGKSRTGKGVIYVAYRGVHVESPRDAYLIRLARDFKATIFFDAMDLWKKAEKAGSEDFLLQRYERGAFVARVLYPDRGAHKDTQYFDIFGATLIATNETVHPALESRSVPITMPETSRQFGDIPLDLALSLKERLVAFRARHLGERLPDIEKPAKGGLGDILKPLMQVILLVDPSKEKEFRDLISELDKERKAQKSVSTEAQLISVLGELETEVDDGLLSADSITKKYNEGKPERFHTSNNSMGKKLRALGFNCRRRNDGSYMEFDPKLLDKLMVKFGLKDEALIPPEIPSENQHNLHKLHSVNNGKGFNGVDSSEDFNKAEESTQNLHSQNPCKYRESVDSEDSEGFSNGRNGKNNSPNPRKIRDVTSPGEERTFQVVEEVDGRITAILISEGNPGFKEVLREYEQQTR